MQDQRIVIFGNPVDGLTFEGPFTDADEAQRYVEATARDGSEWWFASLTLQATWVREEEEPLAPHVTIFSVEEVPPTMWGLTATAVPTVQNFLRRDDALLAAQHLYPDLQIRTEDGKLIVPIWYKVGGPEFDYDGDQGGPYDPQFFQTWEQAQRDLLDWAGLDADSFEYPLKAEKLPVMTSGFKSVEDKDGWLIGFTSQTDWTERIDFYTVEVQ